jgi:hypothetical protein
MFSAAFALCLSARAQDPSSAPDEDHGQRRPLGEVLELHAITIIPASWALPGQSGPGVFAQPAAGLQITAHPFTERAYARVALLGWLPSEEREPWVPDFTYALGYGDWRPWHAFIEHVNYTNTRYPWRTEEGFPVARLSEGLTMAGYRYELPRPWHRELRLPEALWLGGTLTANYVYAYGRLDGSTGHHQVALTNTFRVTAWQHAYAELRAYWWPVPDQQQPWDPDFTWAIGWYDWRPWSVSAHLGNYAGNRWPGRDLEGNGGLGATALYVNFKAGL